MYTENLQETCEIKQPVLFYRGLQELPDISTYKQLLNIKSVNDINPIELPCEAVIELLHWKKFSHGIKLYLLSSLCINIANNNCTQ